MLVSEEEADRLQPRWTGVSRESGSQVGEKVGASQGAEAEAAWALGHFLEWQLVQKSTLLTIGQRHQL